MGDSLDPSPWSRLSKAVRPDWSRTVAARRLLAGALVILAAVAALREDPRDHRTDVVVAVRELSPGVALTGEDVRLETRTVPTVPEGAQRRVDAVVGKTLAGPVRPGEVLTDVRLLSPRLAESAAGPNARIVALPLADAALLDLVRPGDVVDIVAAPPAADTETETRLIATDAVVILVSEKDSGIAARSGNRVVLVALPTAAAKTVAGAALVQAVTLTLH
jgi:Flp pilus assembly protein CpaB